MFAGMADEALRQRPAIEDVRHHRRPQRRVLARGKAIGERSPCAAGAARLGVDAVRVETLEAFADAFRAALIARNWDEAKADDTVSEILAADEVRREAISATQKGQEQRNSLSRQIGDAMKKKDVNLAESLKAQVEIGRAHV